jgi:hypothetical protein
MLKLKADPRLQANRNHNFTRKRRSPDPAAARQRHGSHLHLHGATAHFVSITTLVSNPPVPVRIPGPENGVYWIRSVTKDRYLDVAYFKKEDGAEVTGQTLNGRRRITRTWVCGCGSLISKKKDITEWC